MKIVVLTGDQPNQKALCHKIASRVEIAAIVVSQNIPRKSPTSAARLQRTIAGVGSRLFGRPLVRAWFGLQSGYERTYSSFPVGRVVRVNNINDAATLDTIQSADPDLVVVSGTNLVGKKVIRNSRRIVNLHTGISPYVKGGPNCTNWCLAKAWFHLIGNTVMWLDEGIDTGRIIATEKTLLTGDETLQELHFKVMEHAHELYLRAIVRILEGEDVPSVSQDEIDRGSLFFTKDWTIFEMIRAVRNFNNLYRSHFSDSRSDERLSANVRLVGLGEKT